jgi:hypothetical protein
LPAIAGGLEVIEIVVSHDVELGASVFQVFSH